MKVYTKRGDDGTTALLRGGRVPKDDLRTTAYGTVDETCSALGLARAEATAAGTGEPEHHLAALAEAILRVQRELFVLGAQLATAVEHWDTLQPGVSRLDDTMVDALDGLIDACVERHPLPREFVVPGGNRLAAALDLARSVCRRAEREVVSLQRAGGLGDDTAVRYLNRCSDLLYVLAREAEGVHVSSREGGRGTRSDDRQ